MKLIITEKPSVARDIAKVLKVPNKKDGYFEGNNYLISWAFGHLIRLVDPPIYNASLEKWRLEDLPIIPDPFITEVQPEEHIQKQFAVINTLMNNDTVTEVICATDAGREGELIFRLIYEATKCTKPAKRLWISSQTDQAIKDGFQNLKDATDYIPLYHSAKSRSEADWLIGINATRAYTSRFSRGNGVMSVGRVQTPVLKMIVDRHAAHTQFIPQTYFEISLNVVHPNGTFDALWIGGTNQESRIEDKAKADAIITDLKANPNGIISKLTKKAVHEKAPLLYDLTELQKDANRRYKYSAEETLNLMQALYEKHKVLSYPRTSSRYLSNDIKPKIPGLIQNLTHLPQFEPFASQLSKDPGYQNSRLFDDKKVTDHHAIIPTDKKADLHALSEAEKNIFNMVIQRFLAGLMPECIKDQTEIISTYDKHPFRSFGSIIRVPGWRNVYGTEDLEEANTEGQTLPTVNEQDRISHKGAKAHKKQTKAPPLHTEASILAAMETAGKTIDDDELRQAMKHCGLGTPATRAQILERLIKVHYIIREKNKLIPTPKGIQLIGYIQDKALLSAELTGDWEFKLNQMTTNSYSRETYMNEIKQFAHEIITNVKESPVDAVGIIQNPLGPCPLCQGIVAETKLAYSCSQWRVTQCSFKIWKTIASKDITETMAKDLLKNRKTKTLKGFKAKSGSTFDAALLLDDDGKVTFEFDNSSQDVIGVCPLCKGNVIERAKAFGCANWKSNGCNFVIWKEQQGKTLTKEDAQKKLQG
jgi:DNA topoisomerase III